MKCTPVKRARIALTRAATAPGSLPRSPSAISAASAGASAGVTPRRTSSGVPIRNPFRSPATSSGLVSIELRTTPVAAAAWVKDLPLKDGVQGVANRIVHDRRVSEISGRNPHGNPRVFLAAVGERMTEVAGEVADGVIVHGFTTERYMREVTMPALARGWEKSGKSRSEFELSGPMFVVTGTTEEEMAKARAGTCQQIAFYGSTPAYRGVLDLHGWGDLQPELNRLSKQGEWVKMGSLIDDEMLDAFAVVGEPDDIPRLMLARYGDLLDRISFYAPYRSDPEGWASVIEGFK